MGFTTNPVLLNNLLTKCDAGEIQLPDFQRGWVWDEKRIADLLVSIAEGFPVGAIMSLQTGGPVKFKPRAIEGTGPAAAAHMPGELLLDGQQRMTSLYQACHRNAPVDTANIRKPRKPLKLWFYFNILEALQDDPDSEKLVFAVPESKILLAPIGEATSPADPPRPTINGREIIWDVSTPAKEYEAMVYPSHRVFQSTEWLLGMVGHYAQSPKAADRLEQFTRFKQRVLDSFSAYQLPVITLDKGNSREAVCMVFERVNTGGKPLDAFELITATYAAEAGDTFSLRDEWYGVDKHEGFERRLQHFGRASGQKFGVLRDVAPTEFLQAITLVHTKRERERARAELEAAGKTAADRQLPPVSANRAAMLDLPYAAYQQHKEAIAQGFERSVKFLWSQKIYDSDELPYQSQIVPLAAILAEIGNGWEHAAVKAKIARWYWCGVFGELYGSTTESRFARDVVEVPAWIAGGPEPSTVTERQFQPTRLWSMRSRLSAAYKGVTALLMQAGAKDFRTGQAFDAAVFFDEKVDIHHIFPRKWCRDQGIGPDIYNSVVNKTPIGAQTNRAIGGDAPSIYLKKLESGWGKGQKIEPAVLDGFVGSHVIEPELLRFDDFKGFLEARAQALYTLITQVTGVAATTAPIAPPLAAMAEDDIDDDAEDEDDDAMAEAAE